MRFQASEDFQQNVHHIMGVNDLKHVGMYHVKLLGLNAKMVARL